MQDWILDIISIMKAVTLALLGTLATSEHVFLEQQSIIEQVNKLETTWKAGHNHYFDGRTME